MPKNLKKQLLEGKITQSQYDQRTRQQALSLASNSGGKGGSKGPGNKGFLREVDLAPHFQFEEVAKKAGKDGGELPFTPISSWTVNSTTVQRNPGLQGFQNVDLVCVKLKVIPTLGLTKDTSVLVASLNCGSVGKEKGPYDLLELAGSNSIPGDVKMGRWFSFNPRPGDRVPVIRNGNPVVAQNDHLAFSVAAIFSGEFSPNDWLLSVVGVYRCWGTAALTTSNRRGL